jgi:prepilin-type N-terminal cleavage/methylation domain-containing protein
MQHSPRTPARGFTLVEMLAVLFIIAILMTFLVTTMLGGTETIKSKNTRIFIDQVSTAISDFEVENGRYPPSTFPQELDPKPSVINEGIELLVISLWPKEGGYEAQPVDSVRLGNTDGDDTRTSHTTFTSAAAFELIDDWGNPLAYIYRRDYDKTQVYLTIDSDTAEEVENQVKAVVDPKTGDPFNKRSYQLISAGPDGLFHTKDDVANFTYPDEDIE